MSTRSKIRKMLGRNNEVEKVPNDFMFNARSNALLQELVNDRFQKLESRELSIKGTESEYIENILLESDEELFRRELNRIQIMEGVAGAALVYNDGPKFVALRSISIKKEGGKIVAMNGVVPSYTIPYEDDILNMNVSWRVETDKNGNRVLVNDTYYVHKDKKIQPITKQYPYEGFIPAEVFKNTGEGLNEIELMGVGSLINQLNLLDNALPSEFRRSRSMLNSVEQLNTNGSEEISRQIDSGEVSALIHKGSSSVAIGSGKAYIPANQSAQILLQEIITLEDRVRLGLNIGRDKDSTGTNKTILELTDKDENVLERLNAAMRLRNKSYEKLFSKTLRFEGKNSELEVKIQVSEFLEIKMDLLKASVIETKMKKDNVQSQVDGNKEGDTNE